MSTLDLASLYDVATGALNRSVKRNIDRFPEDFCFQLTEEELEALRFQIGISKKRLWWKKILTLRVHGMRRRHAGKRSEQPAGRASVRPASYVCS
jgi:hypothetical protein